MDATSDAAASADRSWARILAVELHEGERPPAWLAASGKPVIAIRRGVSYADFHEARAACDRLHLDRDSLRALLPLYLAVFLSLKSDYASAIRLKVAAALDELMREMVPVLRFGN